MGKNRIVEEDTELIGRCAIFEDSYYFSFGKYIISCEPRDKGRINFELAEFNFEIDMDKFGFPVRIKKGLLDRIHDLLCLSSIYGEGNFYTALNREIDSFYGVMMTQIYLDRSDGRRWRAPLSAFTVKAAKEFKAVFFDFAEENEVRRGFGLAGKVD